MQIDGTTVKRLRWAAGYTQADLALDAGLSVNTLSNIELGLSAGSARTARKLAKVLAVDVSTILVRDHLDESEAKAG